MITAHCVHNKIKIMKFICYFLVRAYTTFTLTRAHDNSYRTSSLVTCSESAKPEDSLQLQLSQKKMPENSKGLYSNSLQTAQISDLGPAKMFRCGKTSRDERGCLLGRESAAAANLTSVPG